MDVGQAGTNSTYRLSRIIHFLMQWFCLAMDVQTEWSEVDCPNLLIPQHLVGPKEQPGGSPRPSGSGKRLCLPAVGSPQGPASRRRRRRRSCRGTGQGQPEGGGGQDIVDMCFTPRSRTRGFQDLVACSMEGECKKEGCKCWFKSSRQGSAKYPPMMCMIKIFQNSIVLQRLPKKTS